MQNSFLVLLALGFTLISSLYLFTSKRRREVVLSRLRLSRRRGSGAETPPRSLSPKKNNSDSGTSNPDYKDVFPPSRRYTLSTAAPELTAKFGETRNGFNCEGEKEPQCVPFDIPFKEASPNALTPTGFSVEEIKALGDFPDYAALSGIPLPQPYKDFDLNKAKSRPYRPFRWAYHQTMSLTKLEPDWWLEVESDYVDRITQRTALYARHGSSVLDALPGSELACKELMEMCLQFYCARYPMYFLLDQSKMLFHNRILNTTTNLKETPPLIVILNNIPEDFALMLRDPETGTYKFRAGVICSALGWNLGTKIGMELKEIHAPIPDYKEKMQFSMDRYFAKKPTDKAIQRGSWGLEVDKPLYMPPGDPHELHRNTQSPTLTPSQCHLRVDWQTLRRLPLSASIVFNFKALFTPVEQFRKEAYLPSLLLKVLKEGKKNLMDYKGTWHVEHCVIPALEEYEKEQIEKGMVERDWECRTLEESPFFPGWEEKWHREQGF
ncbi:hypothetical protein EJ08DRAFT_699895 [Tothia fuscella]|uniref:Alpha-1,2-mannosyltransferase n=1 Tax=Tothia fuscella TaxID=1048955 RepID=A0A9P4NM83_9PEZI|nr:hypothetical protein EJ08DRAFT_699895 [Tothia fuscella]